MSEHPSDSRSSLELSGLCPHRWHAIYRLGVRDESDAAVRGTVFHAAAYNYILLLARSGGDADAEHAQAAIEAALVRYHPPAHLVGEIRELFRRWSEWFELDVDAFLLAEERQRHAGFTWMPDLVYARPSKLQIKDWKTFYVGFTAAQAKRTFQARFYAWQASKVWPGFPVYEVTFNFVRLGYEVTAEFALDDMDAIENEVLTMKAARARMIEQGRFPARAGSHCAFCTLADCPIATDARVHPVRADQPIAEIAAELVALRQRVAARERILKAHCAANGPLEVGDLVFAHWQTAGRAFELHETLAILAEHGETLAHELSATTLRQYLNPRKYPKIAPLLDAIGRPDPGWQFRAKKAGSVEPEDRYLAQPEARPTTTINEQAFSFEGTSE